jgi:feruloyl esterase
MARHMRLVCPKENHISPGSEEAAVTVRWRLSQDASPTRLIDACNPAITKGDFAMNANRTLTRERADDWVRWTSALGACSIAAVLSGCGGGGGAPAPATAPAPVAPTALACDDTMKTAFHPDSNTTVTFVKHFNAGDSIALAGTPSSPAPTKAPHGLCVVKLNIGPGNSGPAGAPSTSPGIGIEVWMPDSSVWSQRLELNGSGGYAGGSGFSDTTQIGSPASLALAMTDKAVSAESDHGHITSNVDASFGMNPDGSLATSLWRDFAERAVHEMALKVKALASAYYSTAPKYAYFTGCSGGGRDGYSLAQAHPDDFDGILVGSPGIHWTRFSVSDSYPQLVMQRDLGGVLITPAQRSLVTQAAVTACDASLNGQHDGYLSDPGSCSYDPQKDASVLCVADGGTNTTSSCVSARQAKAIVKMWYGPTTDGLVPDPQVDLGMELAPSPNQLWYGTPRGADLSWLTGTAPGDGLFGGPFPLVFDTLAIALRNPSITIPGTPFAPSPQPAFSNATGSGQNSWKNLTYPGLADAYYQGLALQPALGNINTENPDLTAFKKGGHKLLVYHGLADQLLSYAGLVNYYALSANTTGGFVSTQTFHRLFLVPGMGHCAGPGTPNAMGAANMPLPGSTQFFDALKDWVEKGTAPDSIVVSNTAKTNSRPLCAYPKRISYRGGDTNSASNYACQ